MLLFNTSYLGNITSVFCNQSSDSFVKINLIYMVFTKPRGSYNELLTCISSKCKECCLYDDKVFLLSQIINTNGKKSFASDFKTHSDKQAHQKPFLIDLFSARRFSSAQFSRSVVSDSLKPHESQHSRPPCPSPSLGVHSNSCPSSR